MFGLKIEHLSLCEIVNNLNSHSFYAVVKEGALPNYTYSTIKFNLILLRHRGQLFVHFFYTSSIVYMDCSSTTAQSCCGTSIENSY